MRSRYGVCRPGKRFEVHSVIFKTVIGRHNGMNLSLLKGTNFVEGATGKERNEQVGGHRK